MLAKIKGEISYHYLRHQIVKEEKGANPESQPLFIYHLEMMWINHPTNRQLQTGIAIRHQQNANTMPQLQNRNAVRQ